MPLIVFPTSGQFEVSPCRERLNRDIHQEDHDSDRPDPKKCKAIYDENVSKTLQGKVFLTCPMDYICNDMVNFRKDEGGEFDIQV